MSRKILSIISLIIIVYISVISVISVIDYKELFMLNIEKDKTKLYGSLFLDKLNIQIKNMTNPKIEYNDKRIDIINYSDILL